MGIIKYRNSANEPWVEIPALQGAKGDKGDTPDLSGYATTEYVDNAVGNVDIPDVDLSSKADKVHTHKLADIADYTAPDLSGYAKASDIPDVSQFQTATQVKTLIDDSLAAIGAAEDGEY